MSEKEQKKRDPQIALSPESFKDFEQLAKSYDLTNKGLLEAMVRYFKATKADPRDPKEVNPTDAIKQLDKHVIGFIREQEKRLLRPMLDEMRVIVARLGDIEAENKENVKAIRQSQMRVIGGGLKPDLLTDKFLEAYNNLMKHGS